VIRVWCVSIGVEDVLVFEAGVEVGFLVGVEWETDVPIVWDPIFLWAAARVWWQISVWEERCKGSWWVWRWPKLEARGGLSVGWRVPCGATKAVQEGGIAQEGVDGTPLLLLDRSRVVW